MKVYVVEKCFEWEGGDALKAFRNYESARKYVESEGCQFSESYENADVPIHRFVSTTWDAKWFDIKVMELED